MCCSGEADTFVWWTCTGHRRRSTGSTLESSSLVYKYLCCRWWGCHLCLCSCRCSCRSCIRRRRYRHKGPNLRYRCRYNLCSICLYPIYIWDHHLCRGTCCLHSCISHLGRFRYIVGTSGCIFLHISRDTCQSMIECNKHHYTERVPQCTLLHTVSTSRCTLLCIHSNTLQCYLTDISCHS